MFDVIHLLTADSAFPPSLDSMVERYVEKQKYDFEQVVWYGNHLDSERVLKLVSVYEALPHNNRVHLLLSPAMYEVLHGFSKHRSVASLNDLIALSSDELSLVRGTPPRGHREGADAVWSPMGDESVRRTSAGFERHAAIRLDGLVVVDFESPYARAVLPTPLMYRPPEDFTDDERATVIKKFERALNHIDATAPTFGRLIRNYTRAIRVRKCENHVGFTSEHVTNTIGEIRILNAHKNEYGVDRVVEALVHESVHNFLSTYEYLNQLFVFEGDDNRYRPISPWTGNPIPVPSFCHAVFVWFALYHFALLELRQPGVHEQRLEIQRRRNRYAAGFMIPTQLSDCLRGLATFAHGMLPTIDALQDVVRASVAGSATPAYAYTNAEPAAKLPLFV